MSHVKATTVHKREASNAKEASLQLALGAYQEARAEERMKKTKANAVLKDWKAGLHERYKEDMAAYSEQCTTLTTDGTPKKFWPKKPPHPLRGRKEN